eukprot:TRINITY_DN60312_c0_g1_i1.p1 TRINITY_DN60312_c0_g1~~TRINITY_DN60312_c0_g1_i1.p1  ORF type:complete len:188 (-),score=28.80 TRINITY_DN60312_c0_g1_i1:199-738(-)
MPEPKPEQWGVYTNSINAASQHAYYSCQLGKFGMSVDVARLIADFAADGFMAGQFIDVRDQGMRWCVCQILQVLDSGVVVHFIGWRRKYDRFINVPSPVVKPLFKMTKPKPNMGQRVNFVGRIPEDWLPQLLDDGHLLGVSDVNDAHQAYMKYECSYQKTINGLLFENLRNLLTTESKQ